MNTCFKFVCLALMLTFFGCDEDNSVPPPAPLPDMSMGGGDLGNPPVLLDEGTPSMDAESDMTMPGASGDVCQGPDDCESQYCLPDPEGNRVCAEFCRSDDDCPDGWECSPVSNTRPDTVFLCVASRRVQCLPCNQDGDCGTGPDRCIEIGQSLRCATDCSTLECPEGSTCTERDVEGAVESLCIPDDETCEPCDDPDGDGYGNAGECLGVDCDEDNALIHEGAEEICDGLDNDCNSVPDDGLTENDAPEDLICLSQGVCADAIPACLDGAWACTYSEAYEVEPETICDGLDNDCDGAVDEAIEPPASALVQGVCEGSVQVCSGANGFVEPDYGQIQGYEAEETLCDGLDNDCDNLVDESLQTPLADLQAGVCLGAQKICSGNQGFSEPDYGRIMGYENIESTCDGLDNDCDGSIDEALQGPLSDNQVGVCAGALRVCAGADGFVEPDYTLIPTFQADENLCDGLDNDCDSTLDEGIELPEADVQDGVCEDALKVCRGGDGLVEPEYSDIEGYEENELACDGLDNDCDGTTDEAILAPLAQRQSGVCSGIRTVCAGADGFLEPDYQAGIDTYEVQEATCDGLDNDCDGFLDEALIIPNALRQAGVCAGSVQVCAGQEGFIEPDYSALATYQNIENLCDGLDNDCDGGVDEGIQSPLADNQSGVCAGAQRVCSGAAGFIEPNYGELTGYEADEVTCDGLDNDCNGQTDDGLTPPAARLTQGVCEGSVQICRGQAGWGEPDFLNVASYEEVETTCDGLDNDCDGTVDEGLDAPLADNQNGICAGSLKVCAGPAGWIEPDYTRRLNYAEDDGAPYVLDRNCDGVAGNRSEMIFVSENGDNAQDGSSPQRPMASISFAISRCANRAGCSVVALGVGTYDLDSTLLGRGGIHIIGGFGDGFASRDGRLSDLLSSAQVGLLFAGVRTDTEVDGIALRMADQVANSSESIGVAVLDSANHVTFRNGTVHAGRGGTGSAGNDGVDGDNGTRGNSAGGGSAGAAGGAVGGGAGGSGRRKSSGRSGTTGGGVNGGRGGSGGNTGMGCGDGDAGTGLAGLNGLSGQSGRDGVAGDGLGQLQGLSWSPVNGRSGLDGADGSAGGGGGGGAGESCETCAFGLCQCIFCGTGRGGGGGGGAGTAGTGGSGGRSGGASIGFIISDSQVNAVSFAVSGGQGGNGGAGGDGGNGGVGGAGGSGGRDGDSSNGPGGDGGNGGNGGSGGCGGGGGGGPWIGFWGLGDAVLVESGDPEHIQGRGGRGGSSCRNGGPAGLQRLYHEVDVR